MSFYLKLLNIKNHSTIGIINIHCHMEKLDGSVLYTLKAIDIEQKIESTGMKNILLEIVRDETPQKEQELKIYEILDDLFNKKMIEEHIYNRIQYMRHNNFPMSVKDGRIIHMENGREIQSTMEKSIVAIIGAEMTKYYYEKVFAMVEEAVKSEEMDRKHYNLIKREIDRHHREFATYNQDYCEQAEYLRDNPINLEEAYKIIKERKMKKELGMEEFLKQKIKQQAERVFEETTEQDKSNAEKIAEGERENTLQKIKDNTRYEYDCQQKKEFSDKVRELLSEENKKMLKRKLYKEIYDVQHNDQSKSMLNLQKLVYSRKDYINYNKNLQQLVYSNKNHINYDKYSDIMKEMANDEDGKLFQYRNQELLEYITKDMNHFIAFLFILLESLYNDNKDSIKTALEPVNLIKISDNITEVEKNLLDKNEITKLFEETIKQIKSIGEITKYKSLEHLALAQSVDKHMIENALINNDLVNYHKSRQSIFFRFLNMYDSYKPYNYFDRHDSFNFDVKAIPIHELYGYYPQRFCFTKRKYKFCEFTIEYQDVSPKIIDKIVKADQLMYKIYESLKLCNNSYSDLFSKVRDEIRDKMIEYNEKHGKNIYTDSFISSLSNNNSLMSYAFNTTVNQIMLSSLIPLSKDIKKFNELVIDIKHELIKIVNKQNSFEYNKIKSSAMIGINHEIKNMFNKETSINNQFNKIGNIIDSHKGQYNKWNKQLSRQIHINPKKKSNNISNKTKLVAVSGGVITVGVVGTILVHNKQSNARDGLVDNNDRKHLYLDNAIDSNDIVIGDKNSDELSN